MTSRAQRAADGVLKRAMARWLERLRTSETASRRVHERIAERIGRELRGARAATIQQRIASVLDAFQADRTRIVEEAIRSAAREGSRLSPQVARAVFGDARAQRALTPVLEHHESVAQRRIGQEMYGESVRARLARRTGRLGRAMAEQVRESTALAETTEELSARVLSTRDVEVRLPRYIERVRAAAASARPSAVKRTVNAQLEALEAGRIPNHDISRETRRFLERVRRSNGEDIDQAVEQWVRGRAQNQAMTIARTEGQSALNESYVEQVGQQPWVVGVRWNLSPSHPDPDICFPAGTSVLIPDGWASIESISVGDLVIAGDGQPHRVMAVSRRSYTGPVCVIEWEGGSVEATPNHPVATDRGWTSAGALQTEHRGFVRRAPCGAAQSPPSGGTSRTGQRGSWEGAHREDSSRDAPELHDVHVERRFPRIADNGVAQPDTWPAPSLDQEFSERDVSREAKGSGCPATYVDGRFLDAPGSDGKARCASCTSENRNAAPSSAGGTWTRTQRTLSPDEESSGLRERTDTPWSMSGDSQGPGPSTPHTDDREEPWRSLRIDESTTDVLVSHDAGLRVLGTDSGGSVYGSADMEARLVPMWSRSRVDHIGDVLNLHVEGCESYYANGLLVHNCDIMAAQDLHGLGAGGYPAADAPSLAHPNCLCFMSAIVDEHFLEREGARARGTAEPPRPWETAGGVSARDVLDGMTQEQRRSVLGAGRAREFGRRPAKVVNADGSFNPLYQIQGRPPPPLPSGERFEHRRNGEVVRLGARRRRART